MTSVRGPLSNCFARRHCRRVLGLALVACTLLGSGTFASAQSPALAPIYWQQRVFFIPYQVNQQAKSVGRIAKVQLLLSRDGASDWNPLQEAAPNVRGFSYHAPTDGDYWFTLRVLDQRGKAWPSGAVQPQMRIIVDTGRPELHLTSTMDAAGLVVVRYEARDANLRSETLVIEAKSDSGEWSSLSLGPPDVAQPDRLVGRTQWTAPFGAVDVELRASIADRAGHRTTTTSQVLLSGPLLSMPNRMPSPPKRGLQNIHQPDESSLNRPESDPFRTAAKLPAHDWPANNNQRRPAPTSSVAINGFSAPPVPSVEAPPLRNPYAASSNQGWPSRTPAQLVVDGHGNQAAAATSDGWTQPSTTTTGTTSQPASDGSATRMVNSRTFDIEYDLQGIGPWGVAKVELWGTHDGGRTWQSFGVDPDNRSPMRATVPGAGVYGFRILVDGANGVGAISPRAGDEPELVVTVDLHPPTLELLAADLGHGNQADHLLIRWTTSDTNLEPLPIGLFYSAFPNGPWSTIATGLENTGAYTWRLARHVPDRFYLRLEARDTAGNLATHQPPAPITLARPKPTGRLRGVRPVASAP